VVLDAADVEQWRAWTASRGWRVMAPPEASDKNVDQRVLALVAAVNAALPGADRTRVYLAGRGEAASAVFYVASRVPDLWTAAVALGGSPQPAIDTTRFFAGNFTLLPALWISAGDGDQALAEKLKSGGMNLEWRPAAGATPASVLDWLASKRRDEIPAEIDCETTSPQFASCFWIRMTKFDTAARNDVLPSTRAQPGSGAMLDLGGFGFNRNDPGPGVLVTWLPDKYAGPLKMNDRIVALGGKAIANPREYAEMMDKTVEEKEVVVMVQRGGDRVRLETRIILPKREQAFTARVQGKYLAEEKEIQILSRTVTELRLTVPEAWVGSMIDWNGTPVARADHGGCWLLVEEKQLQSAKACP
jgi:hypothetical protein